MPGKGKKPLSQTAIKHLERELETARKKLLDLSLRNRLLNFHPSARKSIQIHHRNPSELYDQLVLKERSLRFIPEDDPNFRTGTSHLPVQINRESLGKKFFHIAQESRTARLEKGYSLLFLALTFLKWTDGQPSSSQRSNTKHYRSGDLHSAPLILIPVALDREHIGGPYTLRWTGEDVITNYSLQTKLIEEEVTLPTFDMPDKPAGISEYLNNVLRSVKGRSGWKIDPAIHLGFFSFTKFLMYRDLDPTSWPEGTSPADHLLLRSLFASNKRKPIDRGFSEADVDRKIDPRRIYQVMDADSSQIAVIEDAKAGRNLVVEGPPGTGKSQTITNIIAELLASGRTVLFVSEKMAALEVVKERLDNVGLGEFCLELHSHKTNRAAVLAELERTLTTPPPKQISLDYEFLRLRKLIDDLNSYPAILHEPQGKLGFSPFQLFSHSEDAARHFKLCSRPLPTIPLDPVLYCTPDNWISTIEALHSLSEILRIVHPVDGHPWFGCPVSDITPTDEHEVSQLLDSCQRSYTSMRKAISTLVHLTGIRSPPTLSDIPAAQTSAKIIAEAGSLNMTMLMSPVWEDHQATADHLIKLLDENSSLKKELRRSFDLSSLSPALIVDLKRYRVTSQGFLTSMRKDHRKLKRKIAASYRSSLPRDPGTIYRHILKISRYFAIRKKLAASETIARQLFGTRWKDGKGNLEELRHITGWVRIFRGQSESGKIRERSLRIIKQGPNETKINKTISDVSNLKHAFVRDIDRLLSRLSTDTGTVFGNDRDSLRLSKYKTKLQTWREHVTPDLHRWGQYISLREKVRTTLAAPVVDAIEAGTLKPEDMAPCFIGNAMDILLMQAFRERPILSSFISELHERKILDFRKLDQDLLLLNRQRLVHRLYLRKPMLIDPIAGTVPKDSLGKKKGRKMAEHALGKADLNAMVRRNGPAQYPQGKGQKNLDPSDPGLIFLKSEFNRKKGHLPIRSLITQTGDLIQCIKPCFMMGPLSIAQFLDPRSIQFDTVIFDEASQVRPEDALGALLRGKQVIVMGDTRQLPPTAFFDHVVDDEEMLLEEKMAERDIPLQAPLSDIESLLHLCKRSFPTKYLKWHYRSRHESLIAVSNQEFYGNRMLVFPSPHRRSDRIGLKFVHLKNTIYDRGSGSVNRKEAKAVARAAIEHFRDHPDKSLGIATFSIKQKNIILEEIDRQLHDHSELEHHFRRERYEYFFVKHLETIQGDERDVILISVGYGFDASGRITMNFGPLNHEGGERRLNVIITRAREKCVVFSNFRGKDLRISKDTPFGLKSLRSFLTFAEKGTLSSGSFPVPLNIDLVSPSVSSPLPPALSSSTSLSPSISSSSLVSSSLSTSSSRSPSGIISTGAQVSPLERTVASHLAEEGFQITAGVGTGGISVNLAIHDPGNPDRFMMGILTDGPGYNRSRIARDRDRLMETVLEGLGWRFVRVWSPDWYRDPEHTMARLLRQVRIIAEGKDPMTRIPSTSKSEIKTRSSGTTGGSSVRGELSGAGSEEEPDDVFHTVQRIKRGRANDRPVVKGIHVPEYEPSYYLDIPVFGNLQDRPPAELATAVRHIVGTEGPVHVDEVVRRIRTLWGMTRTGPKLREHLQQAIGRAEHLRYVFRKGSFLFRTSYYTDDWEIPVRRRGLDVRANIDLICDDEIAESMKLLLRAHGKVPVKDLIRGGTNLLGFTTPGPKVRSRFRQVLDHLALIEEVLGVKEGMVSLGNPSK